MRSRVEAALRLVALAAIAWLLVLALRGAAPSAARENAASLPSALARLSYGTPPATLHARLDAPVHSAHLTWLAAMAQAGSRVAWDAPGSSPMAATADAIVDPAGGTRILVAAPESAAVIIEDTWGRLDSVRAGNDGARFVARSAPRTVTVHAGALIAQAVVTDSVLPGRILVLGGVGWESKFVAAALEERGWLVDLDLALSPRGDVEQGRASALDAVTHSAVIALDTTAARRSAQVARFIAQGGGVVMTSAALASRPLAALAAGSAGATLEPIEPFDSGFADPRRSLALAALSPRTDAVALERRGPSVAVVARRAGRGRVLLVGYDDTWRWRLAGGGDAPQAHRDWWAGLVAAVARARVTPVTAPAVPDEAPYARLVARFGAPSAPPPATVPAQAFEPWLCALALLALLTEWTSRRLRGLR